MMNHHVARRALAAIHLAILMIAVIAVWRFSLGAVPAAVCVLGVSGVIAYASGASPLCDRASLLWGQASAIVVILAAATYLDWLLTAGPRPGDIRAYIGGPVAGALGTYVVCLGLPLIVSAGLYSMGVRRFRQQGGVDESSRPSRTKG